MNDKLRGLYVITDSELIAEKNFSYIIEQALSAGSHIIQYRDKSHDTKKRLSQATEIKRLCEQYQTTFILNDDVELAREVDADGVHIGHTDCSYSLARTLLGNNKIIGVSCYNRLDIALEAQNQGADYVAFGRFFSSKTKPNAKLAELSLLTDARKELTVPICAIGGITLNNADVLIHAGADMLATIDEIFSSDNIKSTCQQFKKKFKV